MRLRFTLILLLLSLALVLPATSGTTARQESSNPDALDFSTFKCSQVTRLVENEDPRLEVLAVWLHGYYTGVKGANKVRVLDKENFTAFLNDLTTTCKADPEKLVVPAVSRMK